MSASKAHIISQLQKEIYSLQGYKPAANGNEFNSGLGPIKYAFPHASFPLAAVHEFFCISDEDTSVTNGFISGILSSLVSQTGVLLWIGEGVIFTPALQLFGLNSDNIIFINKLKQKEKLWAMEEALKCGGLSAVIGEVHELSFTTSRRLQLAVEQSRATAFIIRKNPKNLITACAARWRITSLPTQVTDLPGVGFPRWNVELLKVRNGKPGAWQLEWVNGRFRHPYTLTAINKAQHRKAV